MARCWRGNTTNRCTRNNSLCSNNSNNSNNCLCNNNTTSPTRNCNLTLLDTLTDAIGCRCVCQFLVGENGELEERRGVLEEVGCDYIILSSSDNCNHLLCNACNLQFVEVKE